MVSLEQEDLSKGKKVVPDSSIPNFFSEVYDDGIVSALRNNPTAAAAALTIGAVATGVAAAYLTRGRSLLPVVSRENSLMLRASVKSSEDLALTSSNSVGNVTIEALRLAGSQEKGALPGSVKDLGAKGLSLKETKFVSQVTSDPDVPAVVNYGEYQTKSWLYKTPKVDIFEHQRLGTKLVFPTARPDYQRISVEQARELSERFADPRLVKEIHVSDYAHRDQSWLRLNQQNPQLRVAAEIKPDGTMTLYRPAVGDDLKVLGDHEWSHLHELGNPAASQLFKKLDTVERVVTGNNNLALVGHREGWPILAENLLGKDATLAAATAMRNPLHSTVWSKTFASTLNDVPIGLRSPMHGFYQARLSLVQESAAINLQPALRSLESSSEITRRALAEHFRTFLAK